MNRLLLCFFMIGFGLTAFSQEEINVQNGKIQLNGTLLSPKKSKTLVIIIAGSGPTDRNGNSKVISGSNNSLQYLAEGLESNGVASFRYDKRILNPQNQVDESTLSFDDLVSDAAVVYDHFKNSGKYDLIGFAGHSEGSLIAALAAKDRSAAFVISISGIATSAAAVIKQQLSTLPPDLKTAAFADLDSLSAGKRVDNPPAQLASLLRPSVQPYLISWFKYDPSVVYASLKCPILILQGDNDLQVNSGEATVLLNSNPRATIYVVKGMNHVLKVCSTDRFENISSYSDPKLPVPKELIRETVRFINGI